MFFKIGILDTFETNFVCKIFQKSLVYVFSVQVIGYSIMGAFIFVYLEKENELHTRQTGADSLKEILDDLYGITGRTK